MRFEATLHERLEEESMKLRRNQYCPIHRSLFCCGRELVQKASKLRRLGVQRIEDAHHPGDTASFAPKQRCGSSLIEKLLNRTGNAPSVRWRSHTVTTSFPTTLIPEEWAGRGETTIPTIFRQCISGVTARRGRHGSTSDGRSALQW
jgi:hypothetical protein